MGLGSVRLWRTGVTRRDAALAKIVGPAMPKGIGAGRGGTGRQRGDGGRRRRWREPKRTAGYDDDCPSAIGKPVEPDGNRALLRAEPFGNGEPAGGRK